MSDLLTPDDVEALGVSPADAVLVAASDGGLVLDVTRTLVGAQLTRTMDGAATLSLTLLDPGGDLLRSGRLHKAVDFHYLGTWWRLVKVTKSANEITLTFEDRDVAHLRSHAKPRKTSRDSVTRAQFIQSLVAEVKTPKITFVCPEAKERQSIHKAQDDNKVKRSAAAKRSEAGHGIAKDADVTVKSVKATSIQRRNMERVIGTADTLGAGTTPATALVMAVIQETKCMNLTGGDSSSVGILQLLNIWYGGSTSTHGGRRDIEKCCRDFLKVGFFGFGGAMAFARDHPKESPGSVAAHTQGNAGGAKDYDPWEREAKAWLKAYGYKGAEDFDVGTTTVTRSFAKRYEFRRGEPGQPEDSWEAIQRLAEEVNWRAFMDKGRLYYMSEDRMIRAKPAMTISQDAPGVDWIDFDMDMGKPASAVTVMCRAAMWEARIGAVVAIEDMGLLDGRWLVAEIDHDLFDPSAVITLKSRSHKLPEPAHEVGESSVTTGGSAPTIDKGSPRAIIERVVLPLARKHHMASGITSAGVAAANARHGPTVSGGTSDHQGPPSVAWAADMSNGSAPTPQMDALAKDLAEAFDIPWTGSGLVSKVKGLYRYQLIYRTYEGGNHFNHCHFGVRKS
jgi:hypothetical protein